MQDLLRLYRQKRLGHFYILRPPYGDSDPAPGLYKQVLDFLLQVVNTDSQETIENHPDILLIGHNRRDQGAYKLDEIREFLRFLTYRPLKLPHRFVILENGHLLNHTLQNKLLRSLESPGDAITIFFLYPNPTHLLPTVEGRAVTLRLPGTDGNTAPLRKLASFPPQERFAWIRDYLAKDPQIQENLENSEVTALQNAFASGDKIAPIVDAIKGNAQKQKCVLTFLLDYALNIRSNFLQKEKFLKELAWFEHGLTYNSAPYERFHSLLRTLT